MTTFNAAVIDQPNFRIHDFEPLNRRNPFITDIQYLALEAGVASGASLLISSPKSTGKKWIGWGAAATCFEKGGSVLYLAGSDDEAGLAFENAKRFFLQSDQTGIVAANLLLALEAGIQDGNGEIAESSIGGRLAITTYDSFLNLDIEVGGIGLVICHDLEFPDKWKSSSIKLCLAMAETCVKNSIQFLVMNSTTGPEAHSAEFSRCLKIGYVHSDVLDQ
ncbi:MAG: hypothetical protein KDJ29_05065 [Hyphomicrobiales bacterium]|nr:hypothetical protein [Hyphomicrobiales bacterium]